MTGAVGGGVRGARAGAGMVKSREGAAGGVAQGPTLDQRLRIPAVKGNRRRAGEDMGERCVECSDDAVYSCDQR